MSHEAHQADSRLPRDDITPENVFTIVGAMRDLLNEAFGPSAPHTQMALEAAASSDAIGRGGTETPSAGNHATPVWKRTLEVLNFRDVKHFVNQFKEYVAATRVDDRTARFLLLQHVEKDVLRFVESLPRTMRWTEVLEQLLKRVQPTEATILRSILGCKQREAEAMSDFALRYMAYAEDYPNGLASSTELQNKSSQFRTVEDSLQYRSSCGWVRCVPREEPKLTYLEAAHDDQGHYGAAETERRLRRFAYWPEIAADVARYAASCVTCQMHCRKDAPTAHRNLTWMEANEALALDFIGPLPSDCRKKYILCMIDLCTRFVKLRPCGEANANCVIAGLEEWKNLFGLPTYLVTDNANALVGRTVNQWLSSNGVRRRQIPAYAPQCNGTCERANQEVLRRLRRLSDNDKWVRHLPEVEVMLRTCPNRTTGQSAYMMMMGYQPRTQPITPIVEREMGAEDIASEPEPTRADRVLALRWRAVDTNIDMQAKRTRNERLRDDSLSIDDFVFLYRAHLDQQHSHKLSRRWEGPFEIIKRIANNFYIIRCFDSKRTMQVHRKFLKKAFLRDDSFV